MRKEFAASNEGEKCEIWDQLDRERQWEIKLNGFVWQPEEEERSDYVVCY